MKSERDANHMGKLLRNLLAFGLLLKGLGEVRLPVLLAGMTVVAAVIVCSHFLLDNTANSP